METVLLIILIVLVALVMALLFHTSAANRDKLTQQQTAVTTLQQQLDSILKSADSTRNVLADSLQKGQSAMISGQQSTSDTLSKLNNQIGQIITASNQMQKVGDEVRRLQEILASPNLRGEMGKWSLENLLAQILPQGSYVIEYSFRDGKRVDALVKLHDNRSVSIDAKFSLSNFELMLKAETEKAKSELRKYFLSDVKNRIDEIADKYIRPAEGTLDFALMYIPAENVYYETIIHYPDDKLNLLEYAIGKKVVPVSPNLLYAYLMTVAMGLHGLQVEKRAEEILQNLKKLNIDFAQFLSAWKILGGHLIDASKKYNEGQEKLSVFNMQLNQLQTESKENNPG
jgi:DNA recombination protein RmuC